MAHIKEVARMLAVESRHDFSTIDVGERNDSRFCKPESLFNA